MIVSFHWVLGKRLDRAVATVLISRTAVRVCGYGFSKQEKPP